MTTNATMTTAATRKSANYLNCLIDFGTKNENSPKPGRQTQWLKFDMKLNVLKRNCMS